MSSSNPNERRVFGRTFRHGDKWKALWPNGRRTPSGRPSYSARVVKTKRQAERLLEEIRKAQLRGTLVQDASKSSAMGLTVAEAVDQYVEAKRAEGRAKGTLELYRTGLKAVRASGLGGMLVERVTPQDIEAFLAWRRTHTWRSRAKKGGGVVAEFAKGKTASSDLLRQSRALLSATFNRLVSMEVLSKNPVVRVGTPKGRKRPRRYLGKDEIRRLLAACEPRHLRPIVMAGLFTGARRSELALVRWRDISFQLGTFSVYRPKTGNADTLPLHPLLAQELQRVRERRTVATGRIPRAEDHVFLNRLGRPYKSFRSAWASAVERAGFAGRGVTPHVLRHSFACHYLESGNVRDLQGILGHARLATTEVYLKAMDTRTRAGIEALDYGIGQEQRTHSAPEAKRASKRSRGAGGAESG